MNPGLWVVSVHVVEERDCVCVGGVTPAGQDCAAFWKVCQVVNMLLTLNRERPDRMPASGEGSLESRFAEVYYLLGLMCTDKKDEDEL